MSEIYKNTSNYAYLDIDGGTADAPPTATCLRATGDPVTLTVTGGTVTSGVQRWQTIIPIQYTYDGGDLTVHWSFAIDDTPLTKDDVFTVVVPLAGISDIRAELELSEESVSDSTLIRAERRVRRIIENATGQVFAPETRTYKVQATWSRGIRLPRRLISIDSLTLSGTPYVSTDALITQNGWEIQKTKQYYVGSYIKSGAVIDDPYTQLRSYWTGGADIEIAGRWGWERVPEPIYEAALILLEEILCPESGYRDRYLKSMTAADFRFEYDPEAYVGTGNVIADQILRNFGVPNLAAVL